MGKIFKLEDDLINQIAAGEVIERPSSIVKELIENSIDAQATVINIAITDGGKTLIEVTDNGIGMDKKDLLLCLNRHATSKISGKDLVNINTLGFRGEALPSIGSVSDIKIDTNCKGSKDSWAISVVQGKTTEPEPSAIREGTQIRVTDLFYRVPARLKFLKTNSTEVRHCMEITKFLAMSHPHITFSLSVDGINKLAWSKTKNGNFDDFKNRLSQIVGQNFISSSIPISNKNETVKLFGMIGVPTYNKSTGREQYLFVNGRPVRDRTLFGAMRGAYKGLIAHDRFPVAVLFIEIIANEVDINVHPTKSEVRFKNSSLVRSMIVKSIRNALEQSGVISSSDISEKTISFFNSNLSQGRGQYNGVSENNGAQILNMNFAPSGRAENNEISKKQFLNNEIFPLGAALVQIHETYIIAETQNGIILVDQHAAHERIVLEKMKKSFLDNNMKTQILLIPEVVKLKEEEISIIIKHKSDLSRLGLVIDEFDKDSIIIREHPALLNKIDYQKLVYDLIEEIDEYGNEFILSERLDNTCGNLACHSSIRSGRTLSIEEMNALLRDMEKTPNASQCNHGRPTFIKLAVKDIDGLFGRT